MDKIVKDIHNYLYNMYNNLLKEENNNFAIMLLAMFRRKWLIKHYLSDEEARKLFPSTEMLFNKKIIKLYKNKNERDKTLYQIYNFILPLYYPKPYLKKSIKHYTNKLVKQYPKACRIMFKFIPIDFKQLINNLFVHTAKVITTNDEKQKQILFEHYCDFYKKEAQKTHLKMNKKFLLIDIDGDYKVENILKEFNIDENDIFHIVKTPSNGHHIVIYSDKEKIGYIYKTNKHKDIELKSKNALTHIPLLLEKYI